MKVRKYAISVQWGEGMHAFRRTDYTSVVKVIFEADKLQASLNDLRKGKKGAKPKVHVWERISL